MVRRMFLGERVWGPTQPERQEAQVPSPAVGPEKVTVFP